MKPIQLTPEERKQLAAVREFYPQPDSQEQIAEEPPGSGRHQ